MKNKKNRPETFLILGLIGLHITLALHAGLLWFTDISFWLSLASFGGMYPTWIVFFVIGLVKIRRSNRSQSESRVIVGDDTGDVEYSTGARRINSSSYLRHTQSKRKILASRT